MRWIVQSIGHTLPNNPSQLRLFDVLDTSNLMVLLCVSGSLMNGQKYYWSVALTSLGGEQQPLFKLSS